MFHGNGGNVGHRIPLAAVFYKKMRCNVFMMSYRGYGNIFWRWRFLKSFSVMASLKDLLLSKVGLLDSQNVPQVHVILGLKTDAQTALDYLTSHPDLSRTQIVSRLYVSCRVYYIIIDSLWAVHWWCCCHWLSEQKSNTSTIHCFQ